MVKVKICGITNLADAERAVELGADALGFNFFPPSPRCMTPAQARDILDGLNSTVCRVALFVNEPQENVRAVLDFCQREDGRPAFTSLQFHGEETAEYCRGWGMKVIKAFRVRERSSLTAIQGFPADLYLLDSWSSGYGGSGRSFSWEWIDQVPTSKLVLSGGLTVNNVSEAIHRVHPYAVDVCSGVEARPGIKDHEKLKDFIVAAKNA
jgi:phosphoribosylanthranilate isomerase